MAAPAALAAGGPDKTSEDGLAGPSGAVLARSVAKTLLAEAVLANCVASAWYALGESGSELTWMRHHGIMEETPGFKYAIALHWAVCQFTFSSMEVVPVNTAERTFAVVMPVLSILVLYPQLGSTVVLLSQFWSRPRNKAKSGAPALASVLRQAAALLLVLLTLLAFVALAWYTMGESGYETWATRLNAQDASFAYKYMTALHWALCQVTFASCEVSPASSGERLFASLVAALATVVAYPLMGGILLWLGRLKAGVPLCSLSSRLDQNA